MSKDKVLPEYRIATKIDRVSSEIIEKFNEYSSAPVSDAMRSRNTLSNDIKPVWSPTPTIVGSAVTVNSSVGDEILVLKAIELSKPGDIILVAGNSEPYTAYWGGIMSTMAKAKGVKALITDGMIRDLNQCRELEFPIWATGVTPIAPKTDIPPGDLNFPISIGEVVVHPGDLVIADEDGVVTVPQTLVEEVSRAVDERNSMEESWVKEINATKKMILKEGIDKLLSERIVQYY